MCRNIKVLFNFDPPATEDEIQAAALQYVRKVSGYTNPSPANILEFSQAVEDVSKATEKLLTSMITSSKKKNREVEAEKARARNAKRFGEHA
jgi:hypothetical protein